MASQNEIFVKKINITKKNYIEHKINVFGISSIRLTQYFTLMQNVLPFLSRGKLFTATGLLRKLSDFLVVKKFCDFQVSFTH